MRFYETVCTEIVWNTKACFVRPYASGGKLGYGERRRITLSEKQKHFSNKLDKEVLYEISVVFTLFDLRRRYGWVSWGVAQAIPAAVGLLMSVQSRKFYCAPPGIGFRGSWDMECFHRGVTRYCRLLLNFGWSVFLLEPIKDWGRIYGQLYLQTTQVKLSELLVTNHRLNLHLGLNFRIWNVIVLWGYWASRKSRLILPSNVAQNHSVFQRLVTEWFFIGYLRTYFPYLSNHAHDGNKPDTVNTDIV